jgi:hypothetical protein
MSNLKLIQTAEKAYDSADSLVDSVMEIVGIVPTFPEKVTEQEEADIRKGLMNRAVAKFPTRVYLRDGDKYTLLSPAEAKKADAKKVATFTPETVMTITAHQLGQLKQQEPGRHKVVTAMRKAIQTNASNRYTYIETIAKREKGLPGTPRTPTALLKWTRQQLAGIDKRHTVQRGKGNPEALPEEVVRRGEAAYIAEIEKYLKTQN